jgi:CheY-like chemotaxis protein
VLLVDDEISLIEAMQKILTFEGFTVTIATSGKAALELCRTHPFQIVFLDVNMPDLNGLETFKAMRTIIPGVPVVMITGYGRSLRHLIEEARQLGVRACIDKPFKINQILETIRAVLPSVD